MITVTLNDGRVKKYKDVEEWRADVAAERAAGISRTAEPRAVSFAAIPPAVKLQIERRPKPKKPSAMSTAGLEEMDAGAKLTKAHSKLKKGRKP